MKLSSQITLYLWCAQPLLQSAVAIAIWRRNLRKQFPVFFIYLLAQIAIFAITYPLLRVNYEWFFYSYWVGAAVSAWLSFKVIHEVFLDVFRPYHTLKDLGTVMFRWAGLVMLLVSLVVAFSSSTKADFDSGQNDVWGVAIAAAVTSLQRSVRLVQCGLILFLLLFSRFLGVSKRQQNFGIALGFGLFASVELVLLALFSGGYINTQLMHMVNSIMYDSAIVVWFLYAIARSAARDAAVNPLQTQRWEQSLADLHVGSPQQPVAADSLIPMFEGMVERAFSRGSNLNGHDQAEAKKPPAAAARAGSKSGD